MTANVSIGEFSRLSHLSVKTLRYYHDIELLTPAAVDEWSGYRKYSTTQVETAHLIRRLRDLDMPLPEVRAVLSAPDDESRNSALRAHLERMEKALTRTQEVVASLRTLLGPTTVIDVEYRDIPALHVLAMSARVVRSEIDEWCATAFPALYERAGNAVRGIGGATYSTDFFEHDLGEVVAFVPVTPDAATHELPARRFAVAVHRGPFEESDRTYGALGTHVAEHDVTLAEPIRENYVVGPDKTDDPNSYITEICWPIA